MRRRGRTIALAVAFTMATLGSAQAAGTTGAEARPPAGLMWHRSGLPAVFPLQLRTPPGRDYFLTLHGIGSGEAVLAAFVRGGEFFKVLVPPGTFRIELAAGVNWQGEAALFGPGEATELLVLPEPLTFELRGASAKVGHRVDVGEPQAGRAQISVAPQVICQGVQTEFGSFDAAERARDELGQGAPGPFPRWATAPDGRYDLERYLDGRGGPLDDPRPRTRSRYCD